MSNPYTLPPNYILSRNPATALHHLPAIYSLLQSEKIYWGKHRTLEVFTRQIERAWSCVCIIKVKESTGGDINQDERELTGELAGFARVISDGEGMGYLCDVAISTDHNKLGLAKFMVHEIVENTDGEGNSKDWHWFLWTRVCLFSIHYPLPFLSSHSITNERITNFCF